MANVFVKDETMTEIADAIRSKLGSTAHYLPKDMPEAVMKISGSGGSGSELDPIRFYDYDGTFLYGFSFEEIQEMDSLPPFASHEGLISQGWNWTLEQLKAVNYEVNVGALYVTDDGATRIYISPTAEQLEPTVSFSQLKKYGVAIDWGDGSEWERSEKTGQSVYCTFHHKYEEPGDYVIRLIPDDDAKLYFLGNSKPGTHLYYISYTSNEMNKRYSSAIKKVELGRNIVGFEGYSFCFCNSLESITVPRGVKITNNGLFYECFNLKFFVVPPEQTTLYGYTFYYAYALEGVSLPYGLESLGNNAFSYCYHLKSVTPPDTVTTMYSSVFSECRSLQNIRIPSGVTTLQSNCFYSTYSLGEIVVPDNVTNIASSNFYNCRYLRKAVIGANVNTIGSKNFNTCDGIKEIWMYPETPPTLSYSDAFYRLPSDTVIYVPKGCLEAYQAAAYWSNLTAYLAEMPD